MFDPPFDQIMFYNKVEDLDADIVDEELDRGTLARMPFYETRHGRAPISSDRFIDDTAINPAPRDIPRPFYMKTARGDPYDPDFFLDHELRMFNIIEQIPLPKVLKREILMYTIPPRTKISHVSMSSHEHGPTKNFEWFVTCDHTTSKCNCSDRHRTKRKIGRVMLDKFA